MLTYRTVGLISFWLGAVATASCGARDEPPELTSTSPPFRRVEIIPATATLTLGDTLRFRVVVSPTVTPDAWFWTSSDTTAIRVDAAGLARSLLRTTGVAVCATAAVDPGIKACATIVTPAVP